MNLNGAPGGSQAERPFCPPSSCRQDSSLHDLLSLRPKRRSEQLLLEGGAAVWDKRVKRRWSRLGGWPPRRAGLFSRRVVSDSLTRSARFTIYQGLLRLLSVKLVMPPNCLIQWVSSLHQVAKVLELQLQHQPFQWVFRVDFLQDWLVWSPRSPRDSQEALLASQIESINSLGLSLLYGPTHIHTWLL